MSACIYKLFDPREPLRVRYIGYTAKAISTRLSEHLKEARAGHASHKCNWIRSLLHAGIKPVSESLELVTAGNWQERERFWIALYKDSLTNATAGGEGLVNPSQDVRDRISATLIAGGSSLGNQYRKGIPQTTETRIAISEGLLNSEKNRIAVAASKGCLLYTSPSPRDS